MDVVERVKSLAIKKGETIASIERACSFGQGSIRKWDHAAPSADKLYKVAQMFDVTMEYLLTGRLQSIAGENNAAAIDISADGLQVGHLWDGLDERGRTIVLAKIYERQEVIRASAEGAAPDEGLLAKEA